MDADRGLLYKQKGEINLHYHVEGSRWDENRTLSLLTGELKKKYVSGLGNKIVNYQLEDKFGETSRKVNFTTYMLNHREWVETQTRKIQTEQKQEVYLRDIITLLKKKFPNCEVYTSDKTSTTYGSNGYSVKRYETTRSYSTRIRN